MKNKVEDKKISDLIPDNQNVNTHSQRGRGVVEHSVRRYGIGRGIVAAGKGTDTPQIIGGHLTTEIVGSLDMEDVIFVHTTGKQLVVTVRDDIAPGSVEAIALGLIDNESQKLSYNPDLDILAAVMADPAMQALKNEDKILAGIVDGMGLKGETADAEPQVGIDAGNQFGVIVICNNEAHQEEVFNTLTGMGYKIKVVVV